MKANEIEVNGRYVAKVSGNLTVVKVLEIFQRYTWGDKLVTLYKCRNERTGRVIEVKSPARFRRPALRKDLTHA